MQGLVLEGGSMRPIFSSGVMDALLDEGVYFPYVIGVSAGITDGVSYVSKQRMRNFNITVGYRNDRRYFGVHHFLTDKSIFGLKFLYEDIPQRIIPFDFDTYFSSGVKVRVGVTNALTGEAEYLDGNMLDNKSTILKATCAQPILFPEIKINGIPYYDGGISDSIPAKKALDDGCSKLLIIMTRPVGYVKKLGDPKMEIVAKAMKVKYPNLSKSLRNRNAMYNEQIKYCESLEAQGKAVILRPDADKMISSLEDNSDNLAAFYHHGYDLAMSKMPEIKMLFKEE